MVKKPCKIAVYMKKIKKNKKTWNKSRSEAVIIVGNCDICGKEMINTDSFVVFVTKNKRCYDCYRKT